MYPVQMRKKLLKIKIKEKLSIRKVAKRFGISPTTVFKWTKGLEVKIRRRKASTKIDMESLKRDVEQNPDNYQYERAQKFGVSQRGICYALKRMGVSYKKTLKHPKADEVKRTIFQEEIHKYEEEGRSVVYIDESGFANDMPRTHGYTPIGDRCYGTHDWNAKGRKNLIAALSGSSLIGCGIVEGNVDTAVFNIWIEKILIPDLPKNSVVIMDNATFHKSQRTKELIENNGHKIEFTAFCFN